MSNLKKIEGGVTTPQGFTAGAVYTAIKKRENKKPTSLFSTPTCPAPARPASPRTSSAQLRSSLTARS